MGLRFSTVFLFVGLLVLWFGVQGGAVVPAGASDVSSPSVQLLNSHDEGLLFEVVPPTLERVGLADSSFEQLRMAGYGHLGLAGQPDLPQTSLFIALPPGARAVVKGVESESQVIAAVSVAPAVTKEAINLDLDHLVAYSPQFREAFIADEAIYGQDEWFPAGIVSLGSVSWLRDQRVVQVMIRPVQANPVGHNLLLHTRLRVELAFEYGQGTTGTGVSRPDSPAYEAMLSTAILNYEQGRSWRERPLAPQFPAVSPCLGSNAFRLTLQGTGIYALTHQALVAAGLSGSVSSNTIRMCHGDQEIAVTVKDGGDGTFDSGDSVIFYGEAIKTHDTQTNVYWFTYGGSNGLRMGSVNGSGSTATTSYTLTQHLEVDQRYYSLFPLFDDDNPNVNDHWYWEQISYNIPSGVPYLDVPFTVNNKAAGSYNLQVRAEVWGALANEPHAFEVRLNNNVIGTGQFSGSGKNTWFLFNQSVASSLLQEGNNTIRLTPTNSGSSTHSIIVNWLEVSARRQFVAENNRLAFEQPLAGDWSYSASNFSGTVEVYNVSNPDNPVKIGNATGSGTITFQETVAAPAGYELTSTSAYRAPLTITKDTASNLHAGSNQADYIIITDPSLDSALTPLRNLRTAQGLVVKTVYVQDIFDEFSGGLYSTQAIADFLEFAYHNWNSGNSHPDFVLLAGDGSYDHRNILGQNGGGNLVPVYLRSGIDYNLGETAADNQYVAFLADNEIAQIHLGRLPAQSSSDLSNMINKIVAYESAGVDPTWRAGHFFVVDNGRNSGNPCTTDPAGDFFATMNQFLDDYLFPLNSQFVSRVYYAPTNCYPYPPAYPTYENYYASSPLTLQNRVVDEFNQGRLFISYTGHSTIQTWGNNSESYLTPAVVPSLTNFAHPSIMLPMTCLEGVYQYPTAAGLSETLLRSTVGGAVAAYAPTGLQVQTAHDYLLRGFYEGVYTSQVGTLGEAVMAAKLNLWQNDPSQAFEDLQDTFMLLGDPAMPFNIWAYQSQINLPVVLK